MRNNIPIDDIGPLSTAWRITKGLSTQPGWVMTKATEELGEVARALVGEYEQRAGRGDLVQEAAQTIIVIASLVDITHPEASLHQAITAELYRMGAAKRPPLPPPTPDTLVYASDTWTVGTMLYGSGVRTRLARILWGTPNPAFRHDCKTLTSRLCTCGHTAKYASQTPTPPPNWHRHVALGRGHLASWCTMPARWTDTRLVGRT